MAVKAPSNFETALHEHLRAIRARDIDAFARTIAREALLVGGNGTMLRGIDEVVAEHRDWFATTDFTFETQIVSIVEREDAAWALTRVRYATATEHSHFLLLLVFAPEEGTWKLIYDQNTPLPA